MAEFAALKEIIVKQLGVPEEKVKEEASIQEDLGADSLDVVELIMAIEEKFGLNIEDDQAQGFATVGDVWKFLNNNGVN
ncbi:MAG: Acyl carrier protein [bacterium]|nr:Acyl carrier protein [bacterium]